MFSNCTYRKTARKRLELNTETINLIFIAGVIVVIVGLALWFAMRKQHSQNLQEKFGPEYARSMQQTGDKHETEKTLGEREKRVVNLDIHDLSQNDRNRYHTEWTQIQAEFVDDPSKSLEKANQLITEVMIARGFPVADFEQRAADLSVMYADLVSNYRNANAIALKNQTNQSSTEELRQAMVYYRSLFEELVGTAEVKEVDAAKEEIVNQ
jgi:hypothetical protein